MECAMTDYDAMMKELLEDAAVGPTLRKYLTGFLQIKTARRDLLSATIAHVQALDLLDKLDDGTVAKALAESDKSVASPPSDTERGERA
jgi:hypothetical protein